LSTPTRHELIVWRAFLEASTTLFDVLDEEMQAATGLTLRWYDLLVRLEENDGLRMNEISERILFSKSGLTRMVDRMEDEGLVRRERPASDRRVIQVWMTPQGLKTLNAAREVHRRGIQHHFARHLDGEDIDALAQILAKLQGPLRDLRPARLVSLIEPVT
jgi:DNA-binding MarR family transcriptional regulator